MSTSDVITILCVCANQQEAETISSKLLQERLIACAHIMPTGQSRFWWKGKIEISEEVYMLLKTRSGKYQVVERMIKRMHSYEVPCVVAYEIKNGSAAFLNWVRGEAL